MYDAVVIGAGAAGIAAARRLGELGLAYRLLEARPHPGGRARTDNATFGVPVDLGCHWLHSPALNPLRAQADARGIRCLAQPYATRYARAGAWLDAAGTQACAHHVEACFARIEGAGKAGLDTACSALFRDPQPWDGVFGAEFAAKQGVPLEAGSTLDYARYAWIGADLPVVGGLGNLIADLARDLPVDLATPVARVDHTRLRRVRVETARGVIETRAVILTVSTGVLRADGIAFTPALPDWKRQALDDLPMGSCNKIALQFDRPVFGELRDCRVVPELDAGRALELLIRPDGRNVAIALASGPFGRELAAAGTQAMRACALDHLSALFGEDVRRAARPGCLAADWDGDPRVRGYVAAALPGRADARRALERALDERLYFAGEATHPSFMGDVHGAWLSGIAAAESLAQGRARGR